MSVTPGCLISEALKKGSEAWRREFRTSHIVSIENVFAPPVFQALAAEVGGLLRYARRRDFTMEVYDTPRRMSVVGGRTICGHSSALAALYRSASVVDFLSSVVGEDLLASRQEDAFMAINHLERDGDTQGWHLDDGSTAVIYGFSAPGEGEGGAFEYIPNWPRLLAERSHSLFAAVNHARARGLVRTLALEANSMYILKSDTTLHRVAPLVDPTRSRTVVAAGYETKRVEAYSRTGSDLYDGS